ncbi:transporter substrate-binding domain-containing protein, partial [Gilvimarinus sp. SDUM040013]
MKIRKLFAAAALIAGGLMAAQVATAGDKIRIATEGAYAPFNMVDSSGELIGFDVEIAKALCAQMKADCEIVAQDWDGIIPGLRARKYDAIVASMSITEERMRVVDFSEKYYSNVLA